MSRVHTFLIYFFTLLLSVVCSNTSVAQGLNIDKANLSESLMGYFSFDSGANVVCDYGLGKNNIGSLYGDVTFPAESKYSDNALSISPTNGDAYVVFENDNSIPFVMNGAKAITVAAWVKPMALSASVQNLITMSSGGVTYRLEIASDNNFNSFISTVNPENPQQFGNAFVKATNALTSNDLGNWFHVAISYNGTNTKMYINGVLNNTETTNTPGYELVPWDNRLLYLGVQDASERQFEGMLDELYIFKRELDAEELSTLMNLEKPLDEASDEFEVHFNYYDGEDIDEQIADTSNNYAIKIPNPIRTGYDFDGWFTNAECTEGKLSELADSIRNVSANLTYYAKWEIETYNISYNLNLGVNNPNNTLVSFTVEDLPIELQSPAKDNFVFKYWYTDSGLTQRLNNYTLSHIGDIELWAKWESYEEGAPTYTNYCEMLERDINGTQYGFLAGNKMYYVAGEGMAEYDKMTEFETLGFTHPMFRDGKVRGQGIVDTDTMDAEGGIGHDNWGWEFWRRSKLAYGTLIVNGVRYEHPTPQVLLWRPDQLIVEYQVGGVSVTEEKFISANDVLSSIITADKNVKIEFAGESYYNTNNIASFDGDPEGVQVSQSCESTVNYNSTDNAVVLLENGTAMTKPQWGKPAVVGDMMYSGLNFVFSSNKPLQDFASRTLDAGNIGYEFTIDIPANESVTLSLAVDEVENNAISRINEDLLDIEITRDDKTDYMNGLLNEQIPYFRCSDDMVVQAYYFLWALYFMYFTDLQEGWEQYPHTQTAVNNFMGLHLWDSWAYCAAGSWVADKWAWGHGNALSWKYMVQYKNDNNFMPDNFGTHWYSPDTKMNFDGATDPILQQYEHSGDTSFLRQAYYDLLRPLFIDNDSKAVGINEAQALAKMAEQLGATADKEYWNGIETSETEYFLNYRWPWLMDKYDNDPDYWKSIWNLEELRTNAVTEEMSGPFIEKYVLDTEIGFISPLGLTTRGADSPPNGIFRASSISCWLGIDGLFRQKAVHAGTTATLNHYNAMTREYGYPVAPEAWNDKHQAWGSRYYNWDIAMVMPIIEWLGGADYSFIDSSFTFAPHLPDVWDYIDINVPVVVDGSTNWVNSRVERTEVGNQHQLKFNVSGNPLISTTIKPYAEGRVVEGTSSNVNEIITEAGDTIYTSTNNDVEVVWMLGNKTDSLKTLVWMTPLTKEFYQQVNVYAENILPGTVLHYTTDGSIPNTESPIFSDTITITQTTTFTIKAFANGTYYSPFVVRYENIALIPDIDVVEEELIEGLKYKVYELDEGVRNLPDFAQITQIDEGFISPDDFVPQLDFAAINMEDQEYFALHLSGYINIPDDKIYNFHFKSDDGAILYIDGQEVIKLDSYSAKDPWILDGSIGVESGYHFIDIYYAQYINRQKLELKYRELGESDYENVNQDMFKVISKYCISFAENGGSHVEDIFLDENEAVIRPANPTREGYVFLDWCTDVDFMNVYSFPDVMPNINQRVFAKWDTIEYNITYHLDQEVNNPNSELVTLSEPDLPLALEEPELSGKCFAGWYTDNEYTHLLEANLISEIGEIDLWAKFADCEIYTVTFINGDEDYYSEQASDENNYKITLPAVPSSTDSIFQGWYTASECSGTIFSDTAVIDKDSTLYACWEAKEIVYTLTFMNANEQYYTEQASKANNYKVTLPDNPTSIDSIFQGWYTEPECFGTIFIDMETINKDINLYACWQANEDAYTVKFINGDEEYYTTQAIQSNNYKITLPDSLTSTDSVFQGWYTEQQCSGTLFSDTMIIEQDINLYTCWEELEIVHTVTFMNGEELYDTTQANKDNNYRITLPNNPTKPIAIFKGWYTEVLCSGTQFVDTALINQDITLFACWELSEIVYTVTFINGYDEYFSTQATQLNNYKIALPESPNSFDSTFQGWHIGSACSGMLFIDGMLVVENITLYACWQQNDVSNVIANEHNEAVIYPNPVSGNFIQIMLPNNNQTNTCIIQVFDANGGEALIDKTTSFVSNISLDISTLRSGVYILSITEKNKSARKQSFQFIVE